MRIAKLAIAASLLATGLSLGGCYNDRPGNWGDHHHRGDYGHHHDRGDRGDHNRGDWR